MPMFFATPEEFRQWLAKHHETEKELYVGFYKVGSGKPSITWPQSVDEALCFGWIDGVRQSIDERSYQIRFTPRKRNSIWSTVNLKRIEQLVEQGRVQPAGLAVYQARDLKKTGLYAHERERWDLDPVQETAFRASEKAWQFFQQQTPSYRKSAQKWVVSAKQEATRQKRLADLIDHSEKGQKIPPLRRAGE
ncbi:YdeI family protein [Larkinella bovis]|uniref:YdeI family protein n=1 Tax=Larkinella bovis TaxID=683041 RepID=A0ABW0IL56_9BACT